MRIRGLQLTPQATALRKVVQSGVGAPVARRWRSAPAAQLKPGPLGGVIRG